jgi:hypothetical protein
MKTGTTTLHQFSLAANFANVHEKALEIRTNSREAIRGGLESSCGKFQYEMDFCFLGTCAPA